MSQELPDFIMISCKKEDDGVFIPIEQHTNSDVRPELPEGVPEFFDAKTRWDLACVHGQHERIDIPLDGDLLPGLESFQTPLKTAGKSKLQHESEPGLKGPQMTAGVLKVLEFMRSLALFCL